MRKRAKRAEGCQMARPWTGRIKDARIDSEALPTGSHDSIYGLTVIRFTDMEV